MADYTMPRSVGPSTTVRRGPHHHLQPHREPDIRVTDNGQPHHVWADHVWADHVRTDHARAHDVRAHNVRAHDLRAHDRQPDANPTTCGPTTWPATTCGPTTCGPTTCGRRRGRRRRRAGRRSAAQRRVRRQSLHCQRRESNMQRPCTRPEMVFTATITHPVASTSSSVDGDIRWQSDYREANMSWTPVALSSLALVRGINSTQLVAPCGAVASGAHVPGHYLWYFPLLYGPYVNRRRNLTAPFIRSPSPSWPPSSALSRKSHLVRMPPAGRNGVRGPRPSGGRRALVRVELHARAAGAAAPAFRPRSTDPAPPSRSQPTPYFRDDVPFQLCFQGEAR